MKISADIRENLIEIEVKDSLDLFLCLALCAAQPVYY